MPVIIDANVASLAFVKNCPEYSSVINHLLAKKIKLSYGGKLAKEYSEMADVRARIVLLDRAGIAIKWPDNDIEHEMSNLDCKSNDHHIIALARISKTRVLCSEDKLLQEDFTNKNLISNPRGKIYKNSTHDHLLRTYGK